MKVLVTGAAGFLGRHFVKALIDRDAHVTAVDNLSGQTDFDPIWQQARDESALYERQVAYYVDDAESFLSMNEIEFDLAFHFAAPVGGREKIEGDPLFNADSLRLDAAFFRWASRNPHTTCIYPSSSAVYSPMFQAEMRAKPLQEIMFKANSATWPAPDEMYGFTKLAGEVLAWKAAQYGTNTLVIRPFSGYGEGQSFEYPVPSIAARALRRENPLTVWGSGRQQRDFIHVDDIVNITLMRLEYPLRGTDQINLGSGWPVSFKQVAEICAELVGYAPQVVTDETKPQGVSRRWADTGRMSFYYDPKHLIPLREGLKRVMADVEQRLGVAV